MSKEKEHYLWMKDTMSSYRYNKTNPRFFDLHLDCYTVCLIILRHTKLKDCFFTSFGNRPIIHCKNLSIEYVMYVYGL